MAGRAREIITLPFSLEIDWNPPSVNRWIRMHFRPQHDLKDIAYMAITVAVIKAGAKSSRIPTPCDIYPVIYKAGRRRYPDAHNYTTTIDKLFIDALTEKKGRKRRGLGLIPDDTPEYVRLMTPVIYERAERNRTILTFRHQTKGAVDEDQVDQPTEGEGPRRDPQD